MRFIAMTAVLTALAFPVMADGDCKVPVAQRRTVEELKSSLTAKGWVVHNVTLDDGCYEVYGKDETGQRVQIVFHPASFAELRMND